MPIGYDNLPVNVGLLLDLQLKSGSGLIAHDSSDAHHEDIDLNGPPVWSQRPNDLNYLNFDGAADYLDCLAANTADLDFTNDDYSLAVWVNRGASVNPDIVIARYGVDLDGWELYLETNGGVDYLTLRHHHATLGGGNLRDGCYSVGWGPGEWILLTITRDASSLYPKMYRNGSEVQVTYDGSGMRDPDTCNRDLVLGTRFTKDADWYLGGMWRPRIWERVIEPEEIKFIWESERGYLGL